jgi:hypothetical protein
MTQFKRFALPCAAVAVLAVSFVLGYSYWKAQDRADRPVVKPESLHFGDPAIVRGQSVEAPVILRNSTRDDVVLTGIRSTCGCLTVGANDEKLKFPLPLLTGKEVPLRVRLITDNVAGMVQYNVTFMLTRTDGTPIAPVQLPVSAEIVVPLIAVQSSFYAEYQVRQGSPIRCSTLLASAGVCQEVNIKQVSSSAPERLNYKLTPMSGDFALATLNLRKRYELALEYTPATDQDEFSETLTVQTNDDRLKPLTIRLWGKLRRGFEFSTKEVVFLPRPAGQPMTVELGFRWDDTADSDLSIGKLPPGIECEIKQAGSDRKVLSFTLDSNKATEVAGTEVVLLAGRDREKVRFPITAYNPLR